MAGHPARIAGLVLAVWGAGEYTPSGNRVNQTLVGEFTQDPGDRAVPDTVVLGQLRGGRQRFAASPLPGRQPVPQVVFDAL